MSRRRLAAALMLSVALLLGCSSPSAGPQAKPEPPEAAAGLPAHTPRFGRARPVVAVVGENRFTELTDYVVPYGVLQASGVADVVALATRPGPIQMFPALKLRPQFTVHEFDARVPQGADYVIVPAVHHVEDPALQAWVKQQAAKGATIVGVCDGVWVLAHAGLLSQRRAVGHWYSFEKLEKTFPDTRWLRNRRYLADGPVVTTTGVTASMPVSLALVEAIGGRARAQAVARAMGATGWDARHTSADFQLRSTHVLAAAANWLAFWSHEDIGIPVSNGTDEVALALAADAYARTYRTRVLGIAPSADDVRTRGGLLLLPDQHATDPAAAGLPLKPLDGMSPVAALDAALRGIAGRYGPATAALVALQLEYPQP